MSNTLSEQCVEIIMDVLFIRLRNKIENNSISEGVFYQSE